ncbi:ABC-2 type transport system permease protein [Jeotgalicoccus aerolatus]|uniref:ABC-2 type transport system permease protein n=1 Tax=Jeotgalicoccus aerolatus TaxID=709510 RepID=A0A1G9CQM2_9STAP|nr:ABC transporter permease [Jeotgalicoccus aerolatus]SDK53927.1 ABC-2 type transport system permease protein [Jeotgalicoccus aerolatus]
MLNMIQAEMFKLRLNKSFWVILLTSLVLSAVMHYLAITEWWQVYNTPFDAAGLSEMNGLSMFMAPLFFNLMIGTLAAFYISTDFGPSGVIKNQIISGKNRKLIYFAKYIVYSAAAVVIAVLIPAVTGIILNIIMGNGGIFTFETITYLLGAYSLFSLQLLGYTAIISLLAIITEDSGKTIIFSILFTIVMYIVEKMPKSGIIERIYEYSIFQQFNQVLFPELGIESIMTGLAVGLITMTVLLFIGMIVFSKKEIK